jgi:hypothetical protein
MQEIDTWYYIMGYNVGNWDEVKEEMFLDEPIAPNWDAIDETCSEMQRWNEYCMKVMMAYLDYDLDPEAGGILDFLIKKAGSGGGGSSRKGEDEVKNGIEPMDLETPKDWSTEAIDDALSPAYKKLAKLQSENKDKEVVFFTVYNEDTNEFRAEFFIGKSSDTWLNLSEKPEGLNLSKDDIVTGFVHTHPKGPDGFGPHDHRSIAIFSSGKLTWTNIPLISDITDTRLHDKMFFSVVFKPNNANERTSMSYKRGISPIELYNSIRQIHRGDIPYNRIKALEFILPKSRRKK